MCCGRRSTPLIASGSFSAPLFFFCLHDRRSPARTGVPVRISGRVEDDDDQLLRAGLRCLRALASGERRKGHQHQVGGYHAGSDDAGGGLVGLVVEC